MQDEAMLLLLPECLTSLANLSAPSTHPATQEGLGPQLLKMHRANGEQRQLLPGVPNRFR